MQKLTMALVLLAVSLTVQADMDYHNWDEYILDYNNSSIQADNFEDFNDYPSTYTAPDYDSSGYNWWNEPIYRPAYGTYTRSQALSQGFKDLAETMRGPQQRTMKCFTTGQHTTCRY